MSIVIKNLSFSYGEKKILNNIDLHINSGENVGIIGVSGGGKSTLLKLVSGLYETQSGSITIDGKGLAEQRRKSVAVVMQNASLFPMSIRDNITCGHEMEEDTIFRACEAAKLNEWIKSLPDGLDTNVGERGCRVSGGQAQRIAIARAIAKDVKVILLDEPTSALDDETSTAVMAAMSNLTKGKTVLHISHRLETLATCDHIFRLEGGRLYAN